MIVADVYTIYFIRCISVLSKKQTMVERRRATKINERIKEVFREEKQKVKEGKKPFFMKKAAIKEIALQERYKELKGEGKLQKFLEKKRKRNASKDHKSIPLRRAHF